MNSKKIIVAAASLWIAVNVAGCGQKQTINPGDAATIQQSTATALQNQTNKVQADSSLSPEQKAMMIAGAQRRLQMRPGTMPGQ